MKLRILLFACFSIASASATFAQQAKTVTNADLEKYRNKRVQAERDYEANYARMGFPSPEELQKQIEKSRVERDALSARLTAERLQREQTSSPQYFGQPNVYVVNSSQPSGGYLLSYPYSYRFPVPVYRFGPSYRVGGGMILPNNNVPPRPRPIFGRIR